MTKTIQSVREELEKDTKDTEQNMKDKLISISHLNGFNLGVSLAQKEFLDWLYSHMNKFYKDKIVLTEEDLKELKERLGEKMTDLIKREDVLELLKDIPKFRQDGRTYLTLDNFDCLKDKINQLPSQNQEPQEKQK